MPPANVPKRSRATTNETPKPAQKRRPAESERRSLQQRTKWTDEMERLLLEHLVEARNAGRGGDNASFKTSIYTEILASLRPLSNMPISETQCVSKLDYFKKIWKMWEAHLGAVSGWTWNEEKGVPETDAATMDIYFRAHKDRRRFRHAPPPFKEMLEALFVGVLATGELGLSVQELMDGNDSFDEQVSDGEPTNDNNLITISGDRSPDVIAIESSPERQISWSPSPEPEDILPQSDDQLGGSLSPIYPIRSEMLSPEAQGHSELNAPSSSEPKPQSSDKKEKRKEKEEKMKEKMRKKSDSLRMIKQAHDNNAKAAGGNRKSRSGAAYAVSDSISGASEAITSVIGQVVDSFNRDSPNLSSSPMQLAVRAVSSGFPNIPVEDKLAIFDAFERSAIKAEIFMGMDESIREAWLNNLLRTLRT